MRVNMRTKINLLFLTLIVFTNSVSGDALLSEQNKINTYMYPINYDKYCGERYLESFCFLGNFNEAEKIGQFIKIPEGTGTITFIKVAINTEIYNSTQPKANITVRVYKSVDDNLNNRILFDTFVILPVNAGSSVVSLSFDNPLVIRDEFGISPYKWLFVEIDESWATVAYWDASISCTPCYSHDLNVIYVGDHVTPYQQFVTDRSGDSVYIPSELVSYSPDNSEWYWMIEKFVDISGVDLYFKMYGTWWIPPTPNPTVLPTTTGTPVATAVIPDIGVEPPIPDTNFTIPDYNENSTRCDNLTTQNKSCYPVIIPSVTIPGGTGGDVLLKTMGYCTTEGCDIYDIIDLAYDISIICGVLSFGLLIWKASVVWER